MHVVATRIGLRYALLQCQRNRRFALEREIGAGVAIPLMVVSDTKPQADYGIAMAIIVEMSYLVCSVRLVDLTSDMSSQWTSRCQWHRDALEALGLSKLVIRGWTG